MTLAVVLAWLLYTLTSVPVSSGLSDASLTNQLIHRLSSAVAVNVLTNHHPVTIAIASSCPTTVCGYSLQPFPTVEHLTRQ